MALSNNAEGGTSGVTPTTSDTGSGDAFTTVSKGPVAGILEYTNVSKMHGSLAYREATRGTAESNYVGYTTTAAQDYYGRFYFMCDDVVNGGQIVHFRVSDGGQNCGIIFFTSARKLDIRTPASVSVYLFTNALTLGTWYRVEWHCVSNNTTNFSMQVRLYAGDSTVVIEDSGVQTVAIGATVNTWASTRYGINTASNIPSTTGFLYFDDIRAFDTANWPGPSTASPTLLTTGVV